MNLMVDDYVNLSRGSISERELLKELRKLPEPERFAFVSELLPHNEILGLDLATRCLSKREYFEAVLDWGMDRGDASSIRYWLSCVIPKLGARRMLRILKEEVSKRPRKVSLTLYWLPSLIGNDEKDRAALKELVELERAARQAKN